MRQITIIAPAIMLLLCIAATAAEVASGAADALTAAEAKFDDGDLNGAWQHLEPLLKADDLDQEVKHEAKQLAARVLHARGEEHFRRARIAPSIADFDRELQLQPPDRAAEHWQLGIAYYYAGEYEKGARQFELHKTVNPQDVENAAWHFLCIVRGPKGSAAAARKKHIAVTSDSRVPMAQIQRLFAGATTPEDVLRIGDKAGGMAKFYADLYVGLHYEALGKDKESLRLIQAAADNPAAKDSYMGDVARVHVKLRAKQPLSTQKQPTQPQNK